MRRGAICRFAVCGGIAALLVGLPAAASAQSSGEPADVPPQRFESRPLVGWPLLDFRLGAQGAASTVTPSMCLEVSPWTYVAIEACGSGAGFLTDEPVTEMVHFKLEGSIPVLRRGRFGLTVQPSFGFAEIENGADEPGFRFGPARSEDQREGAGPEGGVSLKVRAWPHERFYVTGELSTGIAYIESAPVVLQRGDGASSWVGSILFTAGIGF